MKNRIYLSRKKKKITAILAITAMLCGMLSGCGFKTTVESDKSEVTTLDEQAEDSIVVGFSQLGSESAWRVANTISVQEAISQENGFFLLFENGRQKQENQIKAVRSFISQRVDYIVLAPVTETGWETVLQEAKEAKIPLILLDRNVDVADKTLYTTWIGEDSLLEGEKAGKWLNQFLRDEGRHEDEINIVVLKGTEGSTPQIGRSEGFEKIASQYKNWHILAQRNADFTTAKGKEVMAELLRQYKDIDVVVSQNDDMTFGAIDAIESAGLKPGVDGDITIISFDAVYDALCLVQEGKINVDIECNPCSGEYVADVIKQLEEGRTISKAYLVDENVFTIDNVDDYIDDRAY